MSINYLLLGISVAALASILSRALPFIFLSGYANAPLLHFLGKQLPGAILIILVAYSLQDLSVFTIDMQLQNTVNGWPLLVASLVARVQVYTQKHSLLIMKKYLLALITLTLVRLV